MNKKKIWIFSVFMVLCISYVAFVFVNSYFSFNGNVPVLSASSDVLLVSVKTKTDGLLEGIKAIDEEDGDLTNHVFIEKISKFDSNKERTITYAVFDSDDNIARTTRKVKYTDYKEPVMTLKEAFVYYYDHYINEHLSYVKATSSIDGDISSRINVDHVEYINDIRHVTFSVEDSCGSQSKLTLRYTQIPKTPNIDIELKTYLKRVKVGATLTEIAPRDTIKSISVMGIKDMSLKPVVELTHDYNPNVPGTYEFIYRISSDNGDYGMTKLVVIVEE